MNTPLTNNALGKNFNGTVSDKEAIELLANLIRSNESIHEYSNGEHIYKKSGRTFLNAKILRTLNNFLRLGKNKVNIVSKKVTAQTPDNFIIHSSSFQYDQRGSEDKAYLLLDKLDKNGKGNRKYDPGELALELSRDKGKTSMNLVDPQNIAQIFNTAETKPKVKQSYSISNRIPAKHLKNPKRKFALDTLLHVLHTKGELSVKDINTINTVNRLTYGEDSPWALCYLAPFENIESSNSFSSKEEYTLISEDKLMFSIAEGKEFNLMLDSTPGKYFEIGDLPICIKKVSEQEIAIDLIDTKRLGIANQKELLITELRELGIKTHYQFTDEGTYTNVNKADLKEYFLWAQAIDEAGAGNFNVVSIQKYANLITKARGNNNKSKRFEKIISMLLKADTSANKTKALVQARRDIATMLFARLQKTKVITVKSSTGESQAKKVPVSLFTAQKEKRVVPDNDAKKERAVEISIELDIKVKNDSGMQDAVNLLASSSQQAVSRHVSEYRTEAQITVDTIRGINNILALRADVQITSTKVVNAETLGSEDWNASGKRSDWYNSDPLHSTMAAHGARLQTTYLLLEKVKNGKYDAGELGIKIESKDGVTIFSSMSIELIRKVFDVKKQRNTNGKNVEVVNSLDNRDLSNRYLRKREKILVKSLINTLESNGKLLASDLNTMNNFMNNFNSYYSNSDLVLTERFFLSPKESIRSSRSQTRDEDGDLYSGPYLSDDTVIHSAEQKEETILFLGNPYQHNPKELQNDRCISITNKNGKIELKYLNTDIVGITEKPVAYLNHELILQAEAKMDNFFERSKDPYHIDFYNIAKALDQMALNPGGAQIDLTNFAGKYPKGKYPKEVQNQIINLVLFSATDTKSIIATRREVAKLIIKEKKVNDKREEFAKCNVLGIAKDDDPSIMNKILLLGAIVDKSKIHSIYTEYESPYFQDYYNIVKIIDAIAKDPKGKHDSWDLQADYSEATVDKMSALFQQTGSASKERLVEIRMQITKLIFGKEYKAKK